jgi:hypothetical protein
MASGIFPIVAALETLIPATVTTLASRGRSEFGRKRSPRKTEAVADQPPETRKNCWRSPIDSEQKIGLCQRVRMN